MVEIHYGSRGTYNTNTQIKFKTSILESSLCNWKDPYTFANETITVAPVPPTVINPNNKDKEIIIKNCAQFIDCICKINNTQKSNATDIEVVMLMYNLIDYRHWCSNANI